MSLREDYHDDITRIIRHLELEDETIQFTYRPNLRPCGKQRSFWEEKTSPSAPTVYTRHRISVRPDVPAAYIPWVLAHELCHVWQGVYGPLEYPGINFLRDWNGVRYDNRVGDYRALPWELHANAYACTLYGDAGYQYVWKTDQAGPRLSLTDWRLV